MIVGMKSTPSLLALACAVGIAVAACHAKRPVDPAGLRASIPVTTGAPLHSTMAAATSEPAPSGGKYSNEKLGIALEWPTGWVKKDSNDYELLLVPSGNADGAPAELTLDVPDLPGHVLGMIPIGMVKNGYVDDLKKAHGQIQIKEETPSIDGAKARKIRVTWKQDGKEYVDSALLLVHRDRVYILRVTSLVEDEPKLKAAYDALVKSLKWTKK